MVADNLVHVLPVLPEGAARLEPLAAQGAAPRPLAGVLPLVHPLRGLGLERLPAVVAALEAGLLVTDLVEPHGGHVAEPLAAVLAGEAAVVRVLLVLVLVQADRVFERHVANTARDGDRLPFGLLAVVDSLHVIVPGGNRSSEQGRLNFDRN